MRTIFLLLPLVVGWPQGIWAQQDKSKPTPGEYNLWGRLFIEQVSADGNWVAFHMSHTAGRDTLYVQHTRKAGRKAFPCGKAPSFRAGKTFACLQGDTLALMDLGTLNVTRHTGIHNYSFLSNGMLAALELTAAGQRLIISDATGKIMAAYVNAIDYFPSPVYNTIAVVTSDARGYTLQLVTLNGRSIRNTTVLQCRGQPVHLSWDGSGQRLAFYLFEETPRVALYDLQRGRLEVLHNNDTILKGRHLATRNDASIHFITKDKLLLSLQYELEATTASDTLQPEIWKATDKELAFVRRQMVRYGFPSLAAVWEPGTGAVLPVNDEQRTWFKMAPSGLFALVADPLLNQPQDRATPQMDIFIKDLASGSLLPLLKGFPCAADRISISQDSRYITYFNNHQWWVYAMATGMHSCLTCATHGNWDTGAEDPSNDIRPYGSFKRKGDVNKVVLYGRFDCWLADLENHSLTRLTGGKEKMRFRCYDPNRHVPAGSLRTAGAMADNLFETYDFNDGTSGYALLRKAGKSETLPLGTGTVSNLLTADHMLIYTQESFTKPPLVRAYQLSDGSSQTLFQSNAHYANYDWGKSILLRYKAGETLLRGALFLPAGYDPKKRYPMVVHIYENQSLTLHRYSNPTQYAPNGFNIAHYTLNGFIVLLPDIAYKAKDPGGSALLCVEAAVREAIAAGYADSDKVGLIGHSFGGYEVNYILTRSSLFAAAVSGAGVADNIAGHFTVGYETGMTDSWRYASQQFRMGTTFFEDPEGYRSNSPLHNAAGISTPLLLWSGKEDKNVIPWQSQALYVALRQLGKNCVMLLYDKEAHLLQNEYNQADLNRRIFQWFSHYLASAPKQEWMQ